MLITLLGMGGSSLYVEAGARILRPASLGKEIGR